MKYESELKDIRNKYEIDSKEVTEQTWRKKVKCQNITRNLKNVILFV